ncbi:proline-rich protein 36-like isoform X1 [Gallus gallus]|uniref:proline-rich protein 36-like isoform X1 n=1 Tax=Gallus gallus TaxID=9031 RepID=UPI001AE95585|nr:proline-rich protein 36-like isoform X1 [Gallus gallus]
MPARRRHTRSRGPAKEPSAARTPPAREAEGPSEASGAASPFAEGRGTQTGGRLRRGESRRGADDRSAFGVPGKRRRRAESARRGEDAPSAHGELLLRRPADSSGDARPRLRGRGRAGPKRRAPADAARPPPRAAAAALPAPAAAARGDTWRLLAPCPLPPPTARIAPVRTVFSPCHLRPLTAPNLAPCPPPLRAPWAALPALATPGWQCPCCWGRWWLQPLWPCCSPRLPSQPLLWPCCSPRLPSQPLLWPCCSPRLPSQPPAAPSSPAYQHRDHGLAAQSGQCEGREESSPGRDQGPVEVADEEEDIEIVVV